ncbi:MAG: thioredoxin family protein [Burkholderiales bacterium]|nr:thioredoxin family protein [Burkholderiales bacterium]MDE1927883.1 thioredoxin family protein [Burkholderiales bacterium]MDE2160207.1 thioredoxin family protein [Burkholderiales bacterium]MDE2501742.1 thioredoxin family protein [Burkholderiales bacterium]
MKRFLAALCMACAAAAACAGQAIYDQRADARLQIAQALAQAPARDVIVIFGANWCGDCKALEHAFEQGETAALIGRRFRVVKVDVGRFDRNVDVAHAYGVPLALGIPALAMLSPRGRVIYATRGGELADARKLGDAGIHDFIAGIAKRAGGD